MLVTLEWKVNLVVFDKVNDQEMRWRGEEMWSATIKVCYRVNQLKGVGEE